jgi:hypothetical protein
MAWVAGSSPNIAAGFIELVLGNFEDIVGHKFYLSSWKYKLFIYGGQVTQNCSTTTPGSR